MNRRLKKIRQQRMQKCGHWLLPRLRLTLEERAKKTEPTNILLINIFSLSKSEKKVFLHLFKIVIYTFTWK